MNDHPESVDEGVMYLFADDTTVYYIGNKTEDVLDGLNRIAEDLDQWSVKNKVCINSEKTEAMINLIETIHRPLKTLALQEQIY